MGGGSPKTLKITMVTEKGRGELHGGPAAPRNPTKSQTTSENSPIATHQEPIQESPWMLNHLQKHVVLRFRFSLKFWDYSYNTIIFLESPGLLIEESIFLKIEGLSIGGHRFPSNARDCSSNHINFPRHPRLLIKCHWFSLKPRDC